MPPASKTRLDVAELGGLCLDHLAQEPEQLARFMSIAGYDPPALRAALGTKALALGLIDYFAGNEPLMLALCAGNSLRPEDFMRIWQRHNRAE